MANIRLGDLLVKAKVINETQLKGALAEQQRWGGKLGEILVRMQAVTEDTLVKALSKQLSITAVNIDTIQGIPPHVRAKVPRDLALDYGCVPLQLRDDGRTLVVALAEPQNIRHLDTLRAVSRCKVVPQVAGRTSIGKAIRRFYDGEGTSADQEGSFKLMDKQGNEFKVDDKTQQVMNPGPPTKTVPAVPAAPLAAPSAPSGAVPPPRLMSVPEQSAAKNPSEWLKNLEDFQRKEVAAIKALVEILIERGVFTREEYLLKVKGDPRK